MRKITFTENAFAEYLYWQAQDKKTLRRINALLKDIARSPFDGLGKPEPLREDLSGYWSRRIDETGWSIALRTSRSRSISAKAIMTIEFLI